MKVKIFLFHQRHLIQQLMYHPQGEIQVSGSARTNAFDNNFITFDSSTETFDETVFTTLMSDTGSSLIVPLLSLMVLVVMQFQEILWSL